MLSFKEYLTEAAADVEERFRAAVQRGHLITVRNPRGVSGWLGPSGTFYSTQQNTKKYDANGFRDEHADMARKAFPARQTKDPFSAALKGGMIRAHYGHRTLMIHTGKTATEAQIAHIHNHAREVGEAYVDTYHDAGLGNHFENVGGVGTYLDSIRRALSK